MPAGAWAPYGTETAIQHSNHMLLCHFVVLQLWIDTVLLDELYKDTPHRDQDTNSKRLLEETCLSYNKFPARYVIVKP